MIHVAIVKIKTVPGMNVREHYRARIKRVAAERAATRTALCVPRDALGDSTACILLTRHGRRVDDDNLQGALKAVRDEVAAWLGIDDGDERVQYCYAQQACKRGGEHVSITFGHITELAAARELLRRWIDDGQGVTLAHDTRSFLAEATTRSRR
jgi:hypothetical protein